MDPLGKTIEIEGKPYEVVGVAKALGSVFGQSQDNFVMIPIESYFKTYGARTGIRLVAKAIDQQHLMEARGRSARAAAFLPPSAARPGRQFQDLRVGDLRQPLGAAHHNHRGMAVGIVSVFMVVGGIVIMNIMLAVVTERTHEIGIRKSLGARRRDILNQYLVESVRAGRRRAAWSAWRSRGCVAIAGAQRSPPCPWRCRGRRCSSAWDFRPSWGCSSASIRRARRPSSIPSKRCGRSDNHDRDWHFFNGMCAGAPDHPRP